MYVYVAVLILLGFFIYAISFCMPGVKNKVEYMVGRRDFGALSIGFSIAATWIWAPALFVAGEQAYTNGWVGLLYFFVPNVLCLLVFAPFAIKVRKLFPHGKTLAEYMDYMYSPRVRRLYILQTGGLAILSQTVQLLAGAKIICLLTGWDFFLVTAGMGLFALFYAYKDGIRASIGLDVFYMTIMLFVCAILVPLMIKTAGLGTLVAGVTSINGDVKSLVDPRGLSILASFGLATFINLIAGPFGDQNAWQLIFSVKENKILKAHVIAAIAFAVVPFSMGILGFLAAGSGFRPVDVSIVNFELVNKILPEWATAIFLIMVMGGLLSTLDSNLCAISAIYSNIRPTAQLTEIKRAMAIFGTIIPILGANIPGLKILHLFLFYGAFRTITLLPTMLTIIKGSRAPGKGLPEKGIYYGILAGLIFGLPVFAYGNFFNVSLYKVVGSLLCLLVPLVPVAVIKGVKKKCFYGNKTQEMKIG